MGRPGFLASDSSPSEARIPCRGLSGMQECRDGSYPLFPGDLASEGRRFDRHFQIGKKGLFSSALGTILMDEGSQSRGRRVDGWLDLMLVQCSCAYFGWLYAKSKDPCR
jgi:hypothetical protein